MVYYKFFCRLRRAGKAERLVKRPLWDRQEYTCTAISPDGRCIARGRKDDIVELGNQNKITWRLTFTPNHYPSSVTISANAKRIVTGTYEGDVHVWDKQEVGWKAENIWSLNKYCSEISEVAISANGERIVAVSWIVSRVWNKQNDHWVMHLLDPHLADNRGYSGATCVAMSPDGKWIITGYTGQVIVWSERSDGSWEERPLNP